MLIEFGNQHCNWSPMLYVLVIGGSQGSSLAFTPLGFGSQIRKMEVCSVSYDDVKYKVV